MKIVFVLNFDQSQLADVASCFPFSVKHVYDVKADLKAYTTEVSDERSRFISVYLLNNAWDGVVDLVCPEMVEERLRALPPEDVLICGNYPVTPLHWKMLPVTCRGHDVVVLDRKPNAAAHHCPTMTAVKKLLSQLIFPHYPDTVEPPSRRVSALFSYARPFDYMAILQQMLHTAHCTDLRAHFFGSHPVSLEPRHLSALKSFRYQISPKIDGRRALVYIQDGRLWVLNRKLEVYEGPEVHADFNNYLLDCEYYAPNNCFYICDCISTPSEYVATQNFKRRFDAANALGRHRPDIFRPQYFTPVRNIRELWQKRTRHSFTVDGIIFTPQDTPYTLGIDTRLFKWKEAGDNTVDLLYRGGQMFCRVKGSTALKSIGRPESVSTVPLYDGGIYECLYVGPHQWRVTRRRSDKLHANVDWVVDNILNSVAANITFERLLAELEKN
jgi:hypothetical protein